jgi:hypothetical protein
VWYNQLATSEPSEQNRIAGYKRTKTGFFVVAETFKNSQTKQ